MIVEDSHFVEETSQDKLTFINITFKQHHHRELSFLNDLKNSHEKLISLDITLKTTLCICRGFFYLVNFKTPKIIQKLINITLSNTSVYNSQVA